MGTHKNIYSNKFFALSPIEVHIWSTCLPACEKDIAYFYSILSEDEKDRAKQFRFLKDQKYFTIARGILRCLLSKYLNCSFESIEIIYGLWGKPTLPGTPIFFNVSHSRDYALYAITKNYEVGIDLEYMDKDFDIEEIASKVFSPIELDTWYKLNFKEKVSTFYKKWTFKEAFLKAYGKGWLEDYNEKESIKTFVLEKDNQSAYPYYFDLIPNFASSLFVVGPALQPIYHAWDIKMLSY